MAPQSVFSLPFRRLRGHKDKIFKPSARTDIQKQFFSHRVVDSWNLLSSKIIEADTVDSFRRRVMRVVPSGEDDLSNKDRLLQRCAPRRSIWYHPHGAAGTEQCREDRSSSAKTITRTPAAEGTALVAGGAAHLLQAGRVDVQDTAYVSTGVSQSAHQSTQWHSVTAVISYSVSRCALQTD